MGITTQMGSDSYSYDNNGNQITRNVSGSSYTLSYDAENRLVGRRRARQVSVSGAATASFVYDGDGNRVKAAITGGATTAYVGNPSLPSGQCYLEWTTGTSTMKKYYYAGATRVAMRTGTSTINYLLGDHLGSQAITTDNNGLNPKEIRYYPWGNTRYTSGTTPTSFKFTGQRFESGIGLYFYRARFYDPSAGRFIQADTVIPNPGNSQDWDRYSYTANNPIKYIDPTGNRKCTTKEAATGDETCEQNYPENEPDYNIHRVIIGAHSSPASGSAITEPEANLPSILNYLISVLGNAYYTLSGAQPYKKDIFTWLSWNEYNDGSVSIQDITINNYSDDITIYLNRVYISTLENVSINTSYGVLAFQREVKNYLIRPINSDYLYTSYPGTTQNVSMNTKTPTCEYPVIDAVLSVNITVMLSIWTADKDNTTLLNTSYSYTIPPR